MCLICMKYRILILIIIIISLGQILLSYIANISRAHTHAHMHVGAHTHTHTAVATAVQVSAIYLRPTVTDRSAGIHSRFIEINTRATHPISRRLLMFFSYKKLLDRTEMRTRDRICFQPIQTVRDISQEDRARIATCSLRTPTDRQI